MTRRKPVFMRDLAELTDRIRAPAAERAEVRSGVRLPIMDRPRVIGTTDHFTTEAIDLSPSRANALRHAKNGDGHLDRTRHGAAAARKSPPVGV